MDRKFCNDTSSFRFWIASSALIRYCENSELVSSSWGACSEFANQINAKNPAQKATTRLTSLMIRCDCFMVTTAGTVKVFARELNAVLLEVKTRQMGVNDS